MMNDYNVDQPPMEAGNAKGDDKEKEGNIIDAICDPFGLVPDNLDEALAHKKKMKAQEEGAAAKAEVAVDNPEDEKDDVDDDAVVDSMFSNFDINCCGKAPSADDEGEVTEFPTEKLGENLDKENPDEQMMKNGENASVMTSSNSHQTRSLAEIAAKMDEIDLETAAEDTAGDQISDDGGSIIKKMGGGQLWYKEPLYAGLIVLCGVFSIAIFIMAILLVAN